MISIASYVLFLFPLPGEEIEIMHAAGACRLGSVTRGCRLGGRLGGREWNLGSVRVGDTWRSTKRSGSIAV
jgi:hypothetical protein